jgi:hypothetical protein
MTLVVGLAVVDEPLLIAVNPNEPVSWGNKVGPVLASATENPSVWEVSESSLSCEQLLGSGGPGSVMPLMP